MQFAEYELLRFALEQRICPEKGPSLGLGFSTGPSCYSEGIPLLTSRHLPAAAMMPTHTMRGGIGNRGRHWDSGTVVGTYGDVGDMPCDRRS